MQHRAHVPVAKQLLDCLCHHATWTPSASSPRPFEHPARSTSSSLASATETARRSSIARYTLHATSLAKLSSPSSSPSCCEPSAHPTLALPNSPDAFLLPQLQPSRPSWAFSVAKPLSKVTRPTSGCFNIPSAPKSSCVRYVSLGVSRFTGTTSPSPERPLGGTATVASAVGYLSELCDVSTALPTLPGSSVTCASVLYRALAASLRATRDVVRHAHGQCREREVERPCVVPMGVWGEGEATTPLHMGWDLAEACLSAARPVARGRRWSWRMGPAHQRPAERGEASARVGRPSCGWAGRPPQQSCFPFYFMNKSDLCLILCRKICLILGTCIIILCK